MKLLLIAVVVCLVMSACSLGVTAVWAHCNDGTRQTILINIEDLTKDEQKILVDRAELDLCKDRGGVFKLHDRWSW